MSDGAAYIVTDSSGGAIGIFPSYDDGQLQTILRKNFSIQELG
jgi:hypothetical protein